MLANRYVAMVDILGFSALIRRKSIHEVVHLVELLFERASALALVWAASIPGHKKSFGGTFRPRRLHFSDTILFWSPPIDGRLPHESTIIHLFFLAVSQFLFEGFITGIPLRAGIGFGQIYIDARKRIIVGQALVDAHTAEASQEWIGGALHPGCPVESLLRKPNLPIVEYPIPTKPSSDIRLLHALNWTDRAVGPGQAQLKRECGYSPREAFEQALDHYISAQLSSPAARKYENTKRFYEHQMATRPKWITSDGIVTDT